MSRWLGRNDCDISKVLRPTLDFFGVGYLCFSQSVGKIEQDDDFSIQENKVMYTERIKPLFDERHCELSKNADDLFKFID